MLPESITTGATYLAVVGLVVALRRLICCKTPSTLCGRSSKQDYSAHADDVGLKTMETCAELNNWQAKSTVFCPESWRMKSLPLVLKQHSRRRRRLVLRIIIINNNNKEEGRQFILLLPLHKATVPAT